MTILLQKASEVNSQNMRKRVSNPWVAYSSDVIFEDEKLSELLEIKCPFKGKITTIYNRNRKKKHRYYGQVQLRMIIINVKKNFFVMYASFDKTSVDISEAESLWRLICSSQIKQSKTQPTLQKARYSKNRQVLVDLTQTSLQRILWRESQEEPIKIFKLLTLIYGTSSALFLPTRVLKKLAEDNADRYPRAS
ncbi:PREDICTED: uncharacterized protein LOC105623327 [Atta cephalotes]|uniref:YqaJ viral recombinase domain-containing protein n=1 Tax=Atta cephalotes TaxID=12957 RepID=A0A158NRF6_ATTCE|nr:PREDICTED: uncharacterized protein LOC105623327 [Atta cephalotes]